MQTFTPANSEAMANAINRVFAPFDQLGLERAVFSTADENSTAYDGGTWHFVTSGTWHFVTNGTVGFWYPADRETYSVACSNYYLNDAMQAKAFGAGCTLVAFNTLLWFLHQRQMPEDILDAANDLYYALRNWIFDLSEAGELDGAAVASFID